MWRRPFVRLILQFAITYQCWWCFPCPFPETFELKLILWPCLGTGHRKWKKKMQLDGLIPSSRSYTQGHTAAGAAPSPSAPFGFIFSLSCRPRELAVAHFYACLFCWIIWRFVCLTKVDSSWCANSVLSGQSFSVSMMTPGFCIKYEELLETSQRKV